MTTGGGNGGEYCSVCHLKLGMREPRVTAISSEGGKKREEFCISIDSFKQVLGVPELRAGVVPGLSPIGKGNYHLDLTTFFKTLGDHVQKLAACLPRHLREQYLPVTKSPPAQTNGLRVVQA